MPFAQRLLAIQLILGLVACGGPEPLPDRNQPTNNPNINGLGTTDCAFGLGGTDSDGDGRVDSCEDNVGTPTGNGDCDGDGILDGYDNPLDCSDACNDPANAASCQDDQNRMYNDLLNPLLLGSQAMTGKSTPGTFAAVEKQLFRIIHGNSAPNGAPQSLVDFCTKGANGATSFLYVYFDGKVKVCGSSDPATCEKKPMVAASLELCAKINASSGPLDGREITQASITDLEFVIGKADGKEFSPPSLSPKNGETLNKVNITLQDPKTCTVSGATTTSLKIYDNMETDWETKYQFSGKIEVPVTDNKTETIDVSGTTSRSLKNWKRNGSPCDQADKIPGATGLWVNG